VKAWWHKYNLKKIEEKHVNKKAILAVVNGQLAVRLELVQPGVRASAQRGSARRRTL